MSQPKRFRCLTTEEQREFNNKVIMPGLVMCDDGNLVAYSDYAALAAENERLRTQVGCDAIDREYGMCCDASFQIKRLTAENERLTAEVEWLRKADRLVCWNPGTQEWEVRHEAPKS